MNTIDEGVQEFFESLGYSVTWDFSRRLGEEWWEIGNENGLICQIDTGIPLTAIIDDLAAMHTKEKVETGYAYKICGPDSPEFSELVGRVYKTKIKAKT